MSNTALNVALALGTAVLLKKMVSAEPKLVEPYFGSMVPQTIKTQRVATKLVNGSLKTYQVPGTWQSAVPPRLSNYDVGANIRYNTPPTQFLAANPAQPLEMARIVPANQTVIRETFEQEQSQSAVPQFQAQLQGLKKIDITNMLPVQSAQEAMPNELGEDAVQPIVYDRFYYANQRSRYYKLGDPIRGDLPIMPAETGWFRTSVQPNIDLQAGSLAVIGGAQNETTQQLLALQSAARNGFNNVGSGISYSVQQSPYTTMQGGDISVTAFP